ncbi:putative baseplate assembly protein [Calothrix sp. 336/3]|uniref:putative baseplate assembly protein n=1 Tax=Calothrix sp. 336/3 TaxID=1337936 RepID=UPI0004E43380|nr:putative baseplate assembly protein [Calothrix sp. 336/3]AKG20486.1 hypothetical protein IJ00_03405 [Calothrix sp. 336/3]
MDFNFLSKLPKSDLDDRTFQDLVEECVLRIPRYCPEWTNFNPGDPGMTMVELFAWLTDQMMMRFNQVPRRNYVTFLEMLGIRLQPPAPAQTELTFYLSAPHSNAYVISAGVEVATLRTEKEEAIVFSTDRDLVIACPEITHFLTAQTAEHIPQLLRDRLTNTWSKNGDGIWEGRKQSIFEEQPQPGNCFYVVLSPDQPLEGNVIAVKLQGETATATGINPDNPPRRWEAWDGEDWVTVLLQEADDSSKGFSFNESGQGVNTLAEGDVVLHLPQTFPNSYFAAYQGRWLRCTYTLPSGIQSGYLRSPQLSGMGVKAIGGTVAASQCTLVADEVLGISDGTPGQKFQLQNGSILPRRQGEHLIVLPPGGLPEIWQEVSDFADSQEQDRHYIIDDQTGEVQFGFVIRQSNQIREDTQLRAKIQVNGATSLQVQEQVAEVQRMERQYGAIPPRGSQIRMALYRTGGGRKGNVQAHTLETPKTAIPYVEKVTNHVPARNGADAETLDEAVMRVPRILRTRDRAVTPEDFETLALQGGKGAIARAYCPPRSNNETSRGVVDLLIVPQANTDSIFYGEGINPQQFALNLSLKTQLLNYLDERRLLGVEVRLQEPEYVGVAVQAEVGLYPEYSNRQAQQSVLQKLQVSLYHFLNPLTGGVNGTGWEFGACVYPSDIISLFQKTEGVRYLGTILLFELRKEGSSWFRSLAPGGIVNPTPQGLICSWADNQLRSSHTITLI